jgi:hypothetical protein
MMMRGLLAGALVLGLGALGAAQQQVAPATPKRAEATLYFFTSPEAESGPEAVRKLAQFIKPKMKEISLRPVLLVTDFAVLRKLTERSPLTKTLKELEKIGPLDVPLYDAQGLELAERYEVRSVPAFVLVRGGKAHRSFGPGTNLEELWVCK